jgi:outer membrane receptor protein involved in Fe transport
VRLTQTRDRVRWMAGLSYFTLKFITPNGASIGYLYPNAAFPNGFFLDQTIGTDDVVTTAAFGSVSWDFADQWNLSLEGRYQEDEIDEGTVGNVALKKTFSNFLPRAILQWQPSDATNLYVTYAEGNKPGDFNNNLIPLTPPQLAQAQAQTGAQLAVGEEELKMYDLGLKKSLLDRRVQVNTALYFMEWLNQQTRTTAVITDPTNPAGVRTIPVIIAAGQTDLWGLELETQWRVNRTLTLSGTFNYAGSEYKEFICGFCQRVVGTTDMAGNESPRYPKYSGSLSADLYAPLTATLNWFGRADAVYTGYAWDEAFNLAKTSPFWTVNVRGGIEADRWRAELFVTNLFDDDSYPAAARFTDFTKGNFNLNDFTTNVSPADPRQVGVRFSIKL